MCLRCSECGPPDTTLCHLSVQHSDRVWLAPGMSEGTTFNSSYSWYLQYLVLASVHASPFTGPAHCHCMVMANV
jgi:hypothetical protein